jgi:hypothetical protein
LNLLGVASTPGVSLQRGGVPVGRRGVPTGAIPGSGLGPRASPAADIGAGFGPGQGVPPGSYGNGTLGAGGGGFGASSPGGPMNPPSTPSLDAPGNNGRNPDASMSIPDATRLPGARR